MIDYILSFFSIRSLFNTRPMPVESLGLSILLSVFGGFLILAIASRFYAKQKKDDRLTKMAVLQFHYLFLTMGLIGLFYSWLAREGIPFLSMKFLLLIWLVIVLAWGYFAGRNLFVIVPKKKAKTKRQKEFDKYLP